MWFGAIQGGVNDDRIVVYIIELTLHIHSYSTESTNEAEFVARHLQVEVKKKLISFCVFFFVIALLWSWCQAIGESSQRFLSLPANIIIHCAT